MKRLCHLYFFYTYSTSFLQDWQGSPNCADSEGGHNFSTSSFPSTSLSSLCQVFVEPSSVKNKRAKLTWDVSVDCRFPSNLDTLKQSRSSVGPVSQTVGQRYTNLVSMRRGLPFFLSQLQWLPTSGFQTLSRGSSRPLHGKNSFNFRIVHLLLFTSFSPWSHFTMW